MHELTERPVGEVVRATVIPVPGTHGDDGCLTGLWWQSGSPLMRVLTHAGLYHLNEHRPFTWSCDLNGHRFWRHWLGMNDPHRDWIAGGYALSYYLWPVHQEADEYVAVRERNILAHSHGGQVVFYAAAYGGLRINRLLTVGTPIRRDMQAVIEKARPNIRQWLHVRGDDDAVALFGGIGDGRASFSRDFEQDPSRGPDWTDIVPGVGHSGVLHDPTMFYRWHHCAWIEFLKNGW